MIQTQWGSHTSYLMNPIWFLYGKFLLADKSTFRWTVECKGNDICNALSGWKLYCSGDTGNWPNKPETSKTHSIEVRDFTATLPSQFQMQSWHGIVTIITCTHIFDYCTILLNDHSEFLSENKQIIS